jgi:localization factor PodJL
MRAELPWNVAGIPPEAREAARAAARREGLSVGEWLTRRILRSFSDMGQEPQPMAFERTATFERNDRPGLDPWGLPLSAASRRETEDMLARVSRSEAESTDSYRRIEDQLRNVGRRLDTTERSQSDNTKAMSKAASEINIATREQAQAFDQLGGHVLSLSERLERLERNAHQDGLKDAVKGLHQGLSRLADQIGHTASQSATQVSALTSNLEQLAIRLGQARADAENATRALEARIASVESTLQFTATSLEHVQERVEAQTNNRAHDLTDLQKREANNLGSLERIEERIARLEVKGTDPAMERRLDNIERALTGIVARLEQSDPSAALADTLRQVSHRLDSVEQNHNEMLAELRASLTRQPEAAPAAIFPDPEPISEAPPFQASAFDEIPAFKASAFETPVFETRASETSAFQTPAFRVSDLEIQDFETSELETSEFETPVFETPAFEMPAFKTSAFEVSAFETHAFDAPVFETHAFKNPAFENPVSEIPAFEESVFELSDFETPALETTADDVPVFGHRTELQSQPTEDHALGFTPETFSPEGFANNFEMPQDLAEALAEPVPADDNFLSAARRSAKAAADAETDRTTGGFSWSRPAAETADKTSPRYVGVLLVVFIALLVAAAVLLFNQRARNASIATQPVPKAVISRTVTPRTVVTMTPPLTPSPKTQVTNSATHLTSAAPTAKPATPEAKAAAPVPVAPAPTTLALIPPKAAQTPPTASQTPKSTQPSTNKIAAAANAGNPVAEAIIGLKYLDGQGIAADPVQAAKWLQKSAEAGQAVAQYRLGTMYERGQGVAANPTLAAKWYQASANLGNRKAMHNLAVAFAEGSTGKKDMSESARWFSKAAALGLSDSQFNLAVLYERGDGVPQSLIDAFKWYSIAAAAGDAESKTRLAVLQTQLSEPDRAAAVRSAQAFKIAPLNRAANVPPEPADISSN